MKLRGIIVLALALALPCSCAFGQSNQGTSPLSVGKGGTGASTAPNARSNLGAAASSDPQFSGVANFMGSRKDSTQSVPAQITADQNDYNPSSVVCATSSTLIINSDADRNLTGIGGGVAGCDLFLFNNGSFSITLKDGSASSSAANRFDLGADLILASKAAAHLKYDGSASRWRSTSSGSSVISGGGILATGSGGTGATNATNATGDILSSGGTNGTFGARSLNALCTLAPNVCTAALGYTSIAWYGAACDGVYQSNQNFDQPSTNISITSGLKALTSSGSTFTSADVGKRIWVPGAGAAGAGLSSTITVFTDATHVTINDAASTTVSAVAATNAAPFVYGTDDTTAIQNAMTGMATGGTLYIPGMRTGCVIRQQGANTYALLQDKPFTVKGDGHFSNLMTFPDIPTTVDNLFVDGTAGWDWSNVSWTGFSIGASPSFIPSSFLMYKRYGKRGLVLSDSAAANFVGANITNLFLGESGNDHSLYIGNGTSSPSQGGNIIGNKIYGGIHLANVADSFRVQNNFLYGASTFGGLFEFVAGAAGFNFAGNNVTWAGCTIIESGTKQIVNANYFEEVVNASSCARNALVDFNGGLGTIAMPTFMHNVVNAGVSTTATPVRYSNVTGGNFGDNYVSASTSRTLVTSITTMNCPSPNVWSAGTHFSTALANSYAGC